MRVLHFDCFSGISGDMTLAALIDAGADEAAVSAAIQSLGLPIRFEVQRMRRGGFAARQVFIECPPEDEHRFLPDVEAIIDRGALTDRQRDLAKRIFRRLAEAESAAHGMPLDRVHFHEVGALDSIADIIGAAVALDSLAIDKFTSRSVPTGHGTVKCAHGLMPIPAPGTAALLKGVPLAASNIKAELTTPTGAAILTTVVSGWAESPVMTIESIGHGAGRRDFVEQPNLLRVFVGTAPDAPADSGGESDTIVVLENQFGRRAGRGGRVHARAGVGGRRAGRVLPTRADEEKPPRHAADGVGGRGRRRAARTHRVRGNGHAGHPAVGGDPEQVAARVARGRDALGAGARQTRLARRRRVVGPGVRGLRQVGPRTRRAPARGLRRRPPVLIGPMSREIRAAMHIFITAGNTMTPIDRVRAITNIFSGRTGAAVARAAADAGHRVTLATSHPDTVAAQSGLDVVPYRTFDDLHAVLARHLGSGQYHAFVHSAAVADYAPAGVYAPGTGTRFDPAAGNWVGGAMTDRQAGKVKSDEPELWLRLVRLPKLIDLVRPTWGFRGIVVKFKLEVDVSEKRLLEVAEASRRHSAADLMVANTLDAARDWAHLGAGRRGVRESGAGRVGGKIGADDRGNRTNAMTRAAPDPASRQAPAARPFHDVGIG